MSYRNYDTANGRIVDPSGNGDFTTIAAALTAAVSGQTIFIRPGTYTENLTLKAGVNLTAFTGDSSTSLLATTFNVKIVGKISFSSIGLVNISNICLETNGDYLLEVTGSADSIVDLTNCFLNITDNTGINYTTSGTGSRITFKNTFGDISDTGITLYSHSSASGMLFRWCAFRTSASSTTASNNSSGSVAWDWCRCDLPLSCSGTGNLTASYCDLRAGFFNATCLTFDSSAGLNSARFCKTGGGSSAAISIGESASAEISSCTVSSTNTNAITGTGTLTQGGLVFNGTSSQVNSSLTLILENVTSSNSPSGYLFTSTGTNTSPTWQAAGGLTITGDSGGALSPTASNWNILGLSGSKTSGSGSALTVKSPPFSQVGSSATSSLNTGEFVTAAVTRTLPASAGLADGDLFIYVCTTAGALVIQAVGSQQIRLGSSISSAAGTLTSTAIGDSVTLRFNATDEIFYAVSSMGNWTPA